MTHLNLVPAIIEGSGSADSISAKINSLYVLVPKSDLPPHPVEPAPQGQTAASMTKVALEALSAAYGAELYEAEQRAGAEAKLKALRDSLVRSFDSSAGARDENAGPALRSAVDHIITLEDRDPDKA